MKVTSMVLGVKIDKHDVFGVWNDVFTAHQLES